MIYMDTMQINEPLLYIHQQNMTKPKVKMQTSCKTILGSPTYKKADKSFKERSFQEKIDYLIHVPKGIPYLKCEVRTETTSYRGVLIHEDKNHIIIEKYGRKEERILKSTIKDIRLISF